MNRRTRCLAISRLFALSLMFVVDAARGENWTRFRGSDGSGVSRDEAHFPERWTEQQLAWQTDIPGTGHGSPVVWGDRLFVTSGLDDGSARLVFCLNAKTGAVQWKKSTEFGDHAKHKKNSYASTSPAVDEERVYVTFSDPTRYEARAYTHAGELVWTTGLGAFESQHGLGASPVVFEDLLIVPNEQDGPSAIVALDRRTGKKVWSRSRTPRETSSATPLVVELPNQKPQLVCVSGAEGIFSLDPWTGDVNWKTADLPKRVVASPVLIENRVWAICGQGGKGVLMRIADPLASTDANRVVAEKDKQLPYVPTTIGYNGCAFLWGDNGIVTCIDSKTQAVHWSERVGGNYSSSPIIADGKLYCVDEAGVVVVLAAGPKFADLGRGAAGDSSYATPAVSGGRMYFRGFHKVAALVAKPVDAPGAKGK